MICGLLVSVQVLVRLVGADDHVYPNYMDVMRWLAESNLLEMIVDKLSPSVSFFLFFFLCFFFNYFILFQTLNVDNFHVASSSV